MNKILYIILLAAFSSFSQGNNVRLKAEITNQNSDSIVIHNKEFKITLKSKTENFTGDFNAPKGFYQFFDGTRFALLYLNPGFDLLIKADGKRFNETLSFTGIGAEENNYLLQKKSDDLKIKESFGGKLPTVEALQLILDKRMADAKLLLESGKYNDAFPALMLAEYDKENERIKLDLKTVLSKEGGLSALTNTTAPDFNFENYTGGKTTLASLKGKIVYVDLWATWCGPCRAEIPYLKKLEEDFHDKKIEFVSISIDELKNRDIWKKFIADKNLKGIQLLADNAWTSEWVRHFKVEGIPRFIIIGKDGKIIDPNAPRPSSPTIAGVLSDLVK